MTERFVIGVAGGPFGLKGFVKVRSLSGETEHLLSLKSVILRQRGIEKTIEIEESSLSFPAVVMKFKGIDSPEDAKILTGAELIVSREQAAPLNDGEFYIEDLKGLEVISSAETGENTIIGHISDVLEGGGGFLAEIKLISGEVKLVPFRSEFFGVISPEKGRITLNETWILE
jgi:16S rRNA processing protein RimM